jgi:CHAD domain-containing protein/CYTH domain-containing protein
LETPVPKYPKDLLDLPPVVAVEVIGETLLNEAETGRVRLEGDSDEEALHDFRVAIRRLRSVFRAFRPYVDHEITKKLRRRLRDLQRATGGARDAEVQILWVQSRRERLSPTEWIGGKWFVQRLTDKRDRGYEASIDAIERQFPKIDRRVRKSLRAAALDPDSCSADATNYAGALEQLIHDHAATLRRRLEAVHGPADEEAAHAARISAKQLRYLFELMEREFKPAKDAVGSLKSLQDILGELHDAQVVSAELGFACERAAAQHARRLSQLTKRDDRERRRLRRRNATPGMLALVRLCREAHDELFEQFTRWREQETSKLELCTERVLEELRSHAPQDIEVERKYLLNRLPDAAASARSAEVDQGWLPGEKLVERLRRLRTDEGEQYYRTIKAGSGITRFEVEEETNSGVFDQLWPLTEGRRVRKRRYYVNEGDVTWEIDEFLDRELWLAEVELPSPTVTVSLPEWLAPAVEREVTGEPEYVNVNLAR